MISVELRFFSPPSDILRGFEGTEMFSPLNCTDCLPTCHENMYDVDSDLVSDSMPMSQSSFGYLDIYYKNEGAVKYQRDVTFGWVDLLGKIVFNFTTKNFETYNKLNDIIYV